MSEVEKNNPHEYEWELENKNIERGAQKAREQREKQIKRSGMSSTTAGNKLVDESVAGVVAEIERRMKIEEDKTGKLEKQAFYDHIHGLDYAVIAKSALIVCLDAAARAQTWNAAMIPAGRALQMAKFTAAMSVNRRGRRLLADVENRAKNRCKKFADRQKYMMDFAKKQGFEGFELWTEDDYRYCGSFMIDIVHVGSNLIEKSPVPQKGAPDGVQHLQFTAFAVEEMRRTNVRLEELSSWFGPMTAPPTPWPSVNGPYLDPRLWNGMVPMVKKMWSPEQVSPSIEGVLVRNQTRYLKRKSLSSRAPTGHRSTTLPLISSSRPLPGKMSICSVQPRPWTLSSAPPETSRVKRTHRVHMTQRSP